MPRVRLLAWVTLVLVAFVLGDLWRRSRPVPTPAPSVASGIPAIRPEFRSSLPARLAPLPAAAAETLTTAERTDARRDLAAAGGNVYFDTLFAETDSTLRRWPDSARSSLRVAMVPGGPAEWRPAMADQVRDALRTWEGLVSGLHFVEVLDTVGADITVHWVETLDSSRTGQADLLWDRAGRIHHVDVSLAVLAPNGRPLSDIGLQAIALHEIGHALGLAHSPDSNDVLFPATRTDTLSSRDIATIQMLYQLPPGRIKQ